LGIGPMNYACKGPVYRAAHPHSFPMQFLSEWGVPAFALLLVICSFIALKLFQRLRQPDSTYSAKRFLEIALTAGLMAAAIHACLSGVLVMPASQIAGILLCGWLCGSTTPKHTVGKTTASISIGLALILLTSILFVGFALSEIRLHEQRLEETRVMDKLIPRLWQNGKVCVLYQKS
jgi:putative inorganic carbon (HCO3(-)) transporter